MWTWYRLPLDSESSSIQEIQRYVCRIRRAFNNSANTLVTSDRHIFQKDVAKYVVLNLGGANLASAEESDWKRHRSVAMSAFNEASRLSKFHHLTLFV